MALLARAQTFRPVPVAVSRRCAVVVRAAAAEKPASGIVGKAVLVDLIAKEGFTREQAAKAFDALIGGIEDAIVKGDRVTIVGFGTFEVRDRKERLGRNPSTGEALQIPASKTPAFKASVSLKDKVNGKEPAAKKPKAASPAAAKPRPASPAPPAPKKAAPKKQ